MAFGVAGSEEDIASWQEVQRAANAPNRASFPCNQIDNNRSIVH